MLAPPGGLTFPPASVDDIPFVMRPISEGGVLHQKGQVEVVSSLERDGRTIPYDIRFGVFVVFEGETEYIRNCFKEYRVRTDPSGRYACLYKRWHLIGLEVGISVASVGLRAEPTGCATGFRADVVATAKRDLKSGEMLDGEGGYTVFGKLYPARDSLALGGLPLGLAHNVKLLNPIAAGAPVRWSDVQGRRVGHGGKVSARDGARFRAGAGRPPRSTVDREVSYTEPANAAGSRRPADKKTGTRFSLGVPVSIAA